jgi:NDP-sugar pyrophosphorylase family protein
VAAAPLLTYPLRWLAEGGVREAIVCANGTTRAIREALGVGAALGMAIGYYEDGTPRGAAGCVRDAGLASAADILVVADGTSIPTVDLAELLEAHRREGAAVTVVVQREVSAATPLMPVGVYAFSRAVLDKVPPTGYQDIKETLIPRLHRAGERVVPHETRAACPHVFDARTYLDVNGWMVERLGAGLRAAALVDPTAVVDPGARLVGPVQLGARARVAAGATVIGPSSIGADSVLLEGAVVARSAVWGRCRIGALALVDGSILGDDAVVEAGATLLNEVVTGSA